MRRATAAALGTVFGTALLVGAKYGAPSATASAPTAVTAGDSADAGNGAAAGSAAPDASTPAAAAAGTSGAPGAGTAPSGAAHPTTAPPQPARTTPAAGGGGGGGATTAPPPPCSTVSGTGQRVSSPGAGTVTVTIKVCGGAISTASSTLSQSNWSNNSAALPALNSLTPKYYKTNISAIHYSGATLTSNAYQASLRSAMSKAGI